MIFDIIAENAQAQPVLLVEVKTTPLDDQTAHAFFGYMREARIPARFSPHTSCRS